MLVAILGTTISPYHNRGDCLSIVRGSEQPRQRIVFKIDQSCALVLGHYLSMKKELAQTDQPTTGALAELIKERERK
jgi:hypothetical protein